MRVPRFLTTGAFKKADFPRNHLPSLAFTALIFSIRVRDFLEGFRPQPGRVDILDGILLRSAWRQASHDTKG
jgi:hypothetical protein